MNNITSSFCTNLLVDAAKSYSQCVDDHCCALETLISFMSELPQTMDILTAAFALTRAQVIVEATSRALAQARFVLDSTVSTIANDQTDDAALSVELI
jgi:ABC-type enterochelin transport system permease subunit